MVKMKHVHFFLFALLFISLFILPSVACAGDKEDFNGLWTFDFTYTGVQGLALLEGTMEVAVSGNTASVDITGQCAIAGKVYPIDTEALASINLDGDEAELILDVTNQGRTILSLDLKLTLQYDEQEIKKWIAISLIGDGTIEDDIADLIDSDSIDGSWDFEFTLTGPSHTWAGTGVLSVSKDGSTGAVTLEGGLTRDGQEVETFETTFEDISINGNSFTFTIAINSTGEIPAEAFDFTRTFNFLLLNKDAAILTVENQASNETMTSSVNRSQGGGEGGGGGGCNAVSGHAALLLIPLLIGFLQKAAKKQ